MRAKGRGFNCFVRCARTFSRNVVQYPLPFPESEPEFQMLDRVDVQAEELIPDGAAPADRFPLSTAADGNCLPRALSSAVFGSDVFHQELRVRIACELAVNKGTYMSPQTVSNGTALDGETSMNFYHQSGDFIQSTAEEAFEDEAMACAANSKDMGPWQLLAAATILQRCVHSIYPAIGSAVLRREVHRPFLPDRDNYHPIFIMWTTTRDDLGEVNPEFWTANHFVPIVKDIHDVLNNAFHEPTPPEPTPPKIGDFVIVTYHVGRRELVYRGLVIPTPNSIAVREGEFVVRFLRQSGNFFVFPPKDDISVVSFQEASVELSPPPTIDNRGHHFF